MGLVQTCVKTYASLGKKQKSEGCVASLHLVKVWAGIIGPIRVEGVLIRILGSSIIVIFFCHLSLDLSPVSRTFFLLPLSFPVI